MQVEELLERLERVEGPPGGPWKALCPAHPDRNPSLSISLGEGGRIIGHCHANCPPEAWMKAINITWRDLFTGEGGAVTSPRGPVELTQEEKEFRHWVYEYLIHALPVTEEHQEELRGRGLPDGMLGTSYASIVAPNYHRICQDLYKTHGDRLLTVPGFVKGAKGVPTLAVTRGLCIPVRDASGLILAVQVRTGDEGKKYQWLSSPQISSGTPVHVPLGVSPGAELRITEGPLKADVATALDPSTPTIGVAGVSSWRAALPVVDQLKPSRVLIAFDSDWASKDSVANAVYRLAEELDRRGYPVEQEVWDAAHKGIDELLLSGGLPSRVPLTVPEEVQAEIRAEEVGGAVVVSAEEVEELPVEWLWKGWLPRGALTILDGDPGLGKSLLTADLAARISTGRSLPGGADWGLPEAVLMLTSEDDYGRTVRPRLRSAGADLRRVFFFKGVKRVGESLLALPEFPKDLERLRALILRHEIRLVVVDPLYGHLDEQYDAHKDQHVRRVLAGLTQVAGETQAAVLAIRHLNKKEGGSTLYRGSGSIGVIGQARVGWIFAEDAQEADGRHRLLAQVKNNLARTAPTQRVFILDDPVRIQWDGEDERRAGDLLDRPSRSPRQPDPALVEGWLRARLETPRTAGYVYAEAKKVGFTRGQVARAAESLEVVKDNIGGNWYWSAPAEDKEEPHAGFSNQAGPGGPPQHLDPPGRASGAVGRLAPSDPARVLHDSVAGGGPGAVV